MAFALGYSSSVDAAWNSFGGRFVFAVGHLLFPASFAKGHEAGRGAKVSDSAASTVSPALFGA